MGLVDLAQLNVNNKNILAKDNTIYGIWFMAPLRDILKANFGFNHKMENLFHVFGITMGSVLSNENALSINNSPSPWIIYIIT